jgi:hypothetical protein
MPCVMRAAARDTDTMNLWANRGRVTACHMGCGAGVDVMRSGFGRLEDGEGDLAKAQRIMGIPERRCCGHRRRDHEGVGSDKADGGFATGADADRFRRTMLVFMRGIAGGGDKQERTQQERRQYSKPSFLLILHIREDIMKRDHRSVNQEIACSIF